jgi:FkbM family methyltransferase
MNTSALLREYLRRNQRVRRLAAPIQWVRRQIHSNAGSRLADALREAPENVLKGDLVVTAQGFPGAFAMDIRSHVLHGILASEGYEPHVLSMVKQHLDVTRDCIDVGANVGLFTALMASLLKQDKRVLAIEPTPGAIGHLRSNLERSDYSNAVEIFQGVASDCDGEATIYVVPGKEEYSSIGGIVHPSIQPGETRVPIQTSSARIDSLVTRLALQPGFMKIDTEGAEYLVLKGSVETLKQYKPVIISELCDELLVSLGHKALEVVELLSDLGYHVYDLENMSLVKEYPFAGEILAIPAK